MSSVTLQTFKKFPFANDFEVKANADGVIYFVRCKVCTQDIGKIIDLVKSDNSYKGISESMVRKYVDGVSTAHRHNLQRHVNGLAHQGALQRKTAAAPLMVSTPSPSVSPTPSLLSPTQSLGSRSRSSSLASPPGNFFHVSSSQK